MEVTNKAFQRARGKRDKEHSYSVNLNEFYRTQQYFITKIYDGPSIKYVQECYVVLKYLLLINNIIFPFHIQSEGFCLISEKFCFIHTLWTNPEYVFDLRLHHHPQQKNCYCCQPPDLPLVIQVSDGWPHHLNLHPKYFQGLILVLTCLVLVTLTWKMSHILINDTFLYAIHHLGFCRGKAP